MELKLIRIARAKPYCACSPGNCNHRALADCDHFRENYVSSELATFCEDRIGWQLQSNGRYFYVQVYKADAALEGYWFRERLGRYVVWRA